MKSYTQEHELMRRRVWGAAWASTAGAANCSSSKIATRWADIALKEFDVRFKPMSDGALTE